MLFPYPTNLRPVCGAFEGIHMRKVMLATVAVLLGTSPGFSQGSGVAPPAKPAAAASTPEQRSAAALALSHEPTFDEGTAKRIKDAALSYSDIAVRGGWPAIPADAQFAIGVAGPNDDLLRRRLIVSEDLAADKSSGPFDETVAEAI